MVEKTGIFRCKACGYIIRQGERTDRCPACGLPEKVLEPYQPKATGFRHLILDVHLHSIGLHIPQAIGPVFILLYLAHFLPLTFREELFPLMEAMAIAYPFAVLPAIITGLVDGKYRFKKTLTPILFRKLVLALFVLVITTGISAVTFIAEDFHSVIHAIALATAVSLFFQGLLARMGIRLVECMMPGTKI